MVPFLEEVAPHGNGEGSVEQAKVSLINGSSTAIIVVDLTGETLGVIVGEWKMTPGKRIFFVTAWAGGNAMPDELYEDVEKWVMKNGGTAMQCACRDAMGRMLKQRWHYRKVYTIFEKEIV
jgi:hypothetical protein